MEVHKKPIRRFSYCPEDRRGYLTMEGYPLPILVFGKTAETLHKKLNSSKSEATVETKTWVTFERK